MAHIGHPQPEGRWPSGSNGQLRSAQHGNGVSAVFTAAKRHQYFITADLVDSACGNHQALNQ
jgi:hypothetical protein